MPKHKTLTQLRTEIDAIDEKIIGLVGKRQQLAQHVAASKADMQKPVRDLVREDKLLADREKKGKKVGLPVRDTRQLFELLIKFSRIAQREFLKKIK